MRCPKKNTMNSQRTLKRIGEREIKLCPLTVNPHTPTTQMFLSPYVSPSRKMDAVACV